ncbi:hypothetical protein PISMIDRAFT_338461 [Pisolithus microcarpus 441]|uniref:Uncharacterized protein n=1 Tax=Pisolithus microcarpus 441 TaxID=765257 RepID=A0A0C9YKL1_9AGAM|nr:hypothetical protein PISMIDRAFT_338461 [Pisolithus microcarpus 441]
MTLQPVIPPLYRCLTVSVTSNSAFWGLSTRSQQVRSSELGSLGLANEYGFENAFSIDTPGISMRLVTLPHGLFWAMELCIPKVNLNVISN